jgi:hypothetical protein
MKITDDMLTGWFPPHIKPIHPGNYQVKSRFEECTVPWTAYWDGRLWATSKNGQILHWQDRIWRGLKEPQRD